LADIGLANPGGSDVGHFGGRDAFLAVFLVVHERVDVGGRTEHGVLALEVARRLETDTKIYVRVPLDGAPGPGFMISSLQKFQHV
jgi:hypothetical protein